MAQDTIGVFVDASAEGEARLKLARALSAARRAQTRAFALQTHWSPRPAASTPLQAQAESASRIGRAPLIEAPKSQALSLHEDLSVEDVRVEEGQLARKAAQLAHGVDFIVFGQPARFHTQERDAQIAAGLIAGAGRPLLMAPRWQALQPFGRRVFVAWDGGPEAARAAAAGLQFLQRAEKVELIAVERISPAGRALDPDIDVEAPTAWLHRHGVCASARKVRTSGEVWPALDAALQAGGADFVVMGGHGRASAGQLMVGATTAAMMRAAPMPILFCG